MYKLSIGNEVLELPKDVQIIRITKENKLIDTWMKDVIRLEQELLTDQHKILKEISPLQLKSEKIIAADIKENLKDSDYYCLLLIDKPIGLICIGLVNGLGGINLNGMIIDKRYKNLGYGSMFLPNVLQQAKQNYPKAKNITLGVIHNNKSAINVYLKNGFTEYHKSMVRKL